jgi:hypothetical protein
MPAKKVESKIDPDNYIVDTTFLAICFKLTERHINRLAEQGVLKRHRDTKGVPIDGRWNLRDAIADFSYYKGFERDPSGAQ